MIIITISVFSKKKTHYSLSFIVGIFTILFGILISYMLLTFGMTDYTIYAKIGFQILPLWIILYGIFEITNGINTYKVLTKKNNE